MGFSDGAKAFGKDMAFRENRHSNISAWYQRYIAIEVSGIGVAVLAKMKER